MQRDHQAGNEPTVYKKIQNYLFKFSDLLGQGNFSKVYKGVNEINSEVVAIKIIELESLKSKKLEQLLFSQIDILKKLSHTNILKCYEVFTSNRNCYIVTELCNEGDLETRLRKQKFFSEHRAEKYIRDVFEGLIYLNEQNVIHRDIKIANIFLSKNVAKIADFGFAKFTKEKFKDINIGSPIYMAPQGFIHNIYGPKTDVWAFGVMIYELLHGETPFSSCRTENDLKQSLSISLTRNRIKPEVSSDLKDVILKCLQIDQSKRISIPELSQMPYFMKNKVNKLFVNTQSFHGFTGSAHQLRLRTPSYNSELNKFPKMQQNIVRRNSSSEKPANMLFSHNFKLATEGRQYKNDLHQNGKPSSIINPTNKNIIDLEDTQHNRDRRAISSDKNMPFRYLKEVKKEKSYQNDHKQLCILKGKIHFKACVNILHYGRLIFKFLLTLRVSEYGNDNQLFKLSKWLLQLLAEMNELIQRRQVIYQGENANLREQKLRQVRNEYQKKYRAQLQVYMRSHLSYGQKIYKLDHIKSYIFNLYQKYDALISKQANKSLLMIGHYIIMMYQATKLIKQCFDQSNYDVFLAYREIQEFLNAKKQQIDLNSYLNYRKKMIIY